jgi:hypothetical protein
MEQRRKGLRAAEAARILHLSPSRTYGRTDLRMPGQRHGDPVRYDPEKVAAAAQAKARGATVARPDARPPRIDPERGEVAALVFAALDEGLAPVQIVVKHKLEPEHVRDLAGRRSDHLGLLNLTGDQVAALRKVSRGVDRGMSEGVSFFDALLAALRERIVHCAGTADRICENDATICGKCGARPPY